MSFSDSIVQLPQQCYSYTLLIITHSTRLVKYLTSLFVENCMKFVIKSPFFAKSILKILISVLFTKVKQKKINISYHKVNFSDFRQ